MDERPGAVQSAAREQLGAAQGAARDLELEEEGEEEVELPSTAFFSKIVKHLDFIYGQKYSFFVFSYNFILFAKSL